MRLHSRKVQIGAVLVVSSAMLLWAAAMLIGPIGRAPTTPVSEVTRGRFLHRVDAQGVLAAEIATEIGVPMSRRGPMYIGWIAPDGSDVKEGDLLVIQPDELEPTMGQIMERHSQFLVDRIA